MYTTVYTLKPVTQLHTRLFRAVPQTSIVKYGEWDHNFNWFVIYEQLKVTKELLTFSNWRFRELYLNITNGRVSEYIYRR